jgi:uncharacterized membrane protein YccC
VPNLAALKSAARAAIVIPLVFALADKVIQQPQTSLLAAFGSFALLVLVEFTGPARMRLLAYATLGLVGAVFITIGTLCSRNPWLAAGAMAIVGFGVLFSGVINGYFAAAGTAALLTFVLPVTIPAPNSAIPDRLEGWGLATAAAVLAVMFLWPPRARADLQGNAAGALRAVADLVGANGDGSDDRARVAREAVDGLGRRFLGSRHRPTGPTGQMAALASLPDELDWLLSFLASSPEVPALELACSEDAEAMAAAAAVLRAGAERLEGHAGRPDFARLDRARDAVAGALVRRLPDLPVETPDDTILEALEPPFRIRAVTYAARQVATYALLATGAVSRGPENEDSAQQLPAHPTLDATEQFAVEHANVRSVWFQNSVRGAVGLAIAVYIAQRTGLQHSFWVVLGTLSVLRSNALGTGWSILSALAGTAVGLVVGALLVIGIGTHEAVLWAVLPVAILFAAYAPRAISFAAGQAAFTVVLFILFNIIQPVGWKVGLIRIEDVAIGFAISLGVGLLFWPRGASSVLREDLAAAYANGADYVVATARQLIGEGDPGADRAGRAADSALHRLDDAFRQYLAERSATDVNVEGVGALVGGASRVRRSAQSLALLARMAGSETQLGRCGENLDRELHALQAWYVALGYALVNDRPAPPPHIRDAAGLNELLACIRDAARGRDEATVRAALVLLWARQHLDNLWRLEAHLSERALAARASSTNTAGLRTLRSLA